MAADYTAAVAAWLSTRPCSHHQLGDLAAVVDNAAPSRELELEAVRAAVERLDALGLVVLYHHLPPAVGVQHRAGLRRLAGGEPLAAVAWDVEPTRPVTIVRAPSGEWAAWYRTPLRLPVDPFSAAAGAVIGSDPNAALEALRDRVTSQLDQPPDQMLTRQ